MNIILFKSLTTEENLLEIEKQAEKYVDFYMEMEDKPQRKIVKDSAAVINTMLKKIERARIDFNAERKAELESECAAIVVRLKKANEPFTILIDEYKDKRAKQLAKIKQIEDEKEAALRFEEDHENAITLDKIRVFEIEEEKRQKIKYEAEIAREASAKAEREKEAAEDRAEQAEKDKILADSQSKRDAKQSEENAKQAALEAERLAEERRLQAIEDARQAEIKRQNNERIAEEKAEAKRKSDKAHFSKINLAACQDLIYSTMCDLEMAKTIIRAIAKGKVKNVTISY